MNIEANSDKDSAWQILKDRIKEIDKLTPGEKEELYTNLRTFIECFPNTDEAHVAQEKILLLEPSGSKTKQKRIEEYFELVERGNGRSIDLNLIIIDLFGMLEAQPEDENIYRLLVIIASKETLKSVGEGSRFSDILNKFEELAKKNVSAAKKAILDLGDDFYYAGESEQAEKAYESFLRFEPYNTDAIEKITKLRHLVRLEKLSDQIPRQAKKYYYRARSYVAAQDANQAITYLNYALESAQNAGVDFTEARRLIEELQKDNELKDSLLDLPPELLTRYNRALLYLRVGESNKAFEIIDSIIRDAEKQGIQYPDLIFIRHKITDDAVIAEYKEEAQKALEEKKWTKALDNLEHAAKLGDPESLILHQQLAALMSAGNIINSLGRNKIKTIDKLRVEQYILMVTNPDLLEYRKEVEDEYNKALKENNSILGNMKTWVVIFLSALVFFLIFLTLATGLTFIHPLNTSEIDCSMALQGITLNIDSPRYLAYGDEGNINLSIYNKTGQPASGTVIVYFTDNRNVRLLSANSYRFENLAPKTGVPYTVKFAFQDGTDQILAKPGHIEYNISIMDSMGKTFPCKEKAGYIASSPIINLQKCYDYLWGALGITVILNILISGILDPIKDRVKALFSGEKGKD